MDRTMEMRKKKKRSEASLSMCGFYGKARAPVVSGLFMSLTLLVCGCRSLGKSVSQTPEPTDPALKVKYVHMVGQLVRMAATAAAGAAARAHLLARS